MITARTKIVGVIGHPVGHSLSPDMHNAAFAALGMNYCYVAFDVHPDALPEALAGMQALGILGLNVTIPHKPAAYHLVNRLAPSAREVEAVNTIHLQHGLLVGHSTDGEGFARSLEAAGVPLAGSKVAMIGAGGAARSVAAACIQRGAAELTILNRTLERADHLASLLQRSLHAHVGDPAGSGCAIRTGTPTDGRDEVAAAGIVVQCTDVGMHPHEDAPPPIPAEWLPPDALVYDLIYNPEETRLLAAARQRGLRTMNGAEMLIHQGAVAFEIWTGVAPPLDVMRTALLQGMKRKP